MFRGRIYESSQRWCADFRISVAFWSQWIRLYGQGTADPRSGTLGEGTWVFMQNVRWGWMGRGDLFWTDRPPWIVDCWLFSVSLFTSLHCSASHIIHKMEGFYSPLTQLCLVCFVYRGQWDTSAIIATSCSGCYCKRECFSMTPI